MEHRTQRAVLTVGMMLLIAAVIGLGGLMTYALVANEVTENGGARATGLVSAPLSGQETAAMQRSSENQGTSTAKAAASQTITRGRDGGELEDDAEDEDKEDEAQISSSVARITKEEAKDIAEEETGGKATDVDTDRVKGRDAWEIEVRKGGNEADVLVDMETGEVLEVEWEDEEEDDD